MEKAVKMFQEKINFEEAKNKALDFVKRNGPSMPTQVAKEVGIPPLFASALLSQLISEKAVKVSNLKVGGSPLYYIENDKEKLISFINYLPNVEKDVCEKLKREGIIADENVKLAEKVALRNIKDFSVLLSVKVAEEKKIFWKWFSLSQEDVVQKIEKLIKVYEKPKIKPEKRKPEERLIERGEEIQEKKEKAVKVIKSQEEFLTKVKEFLAANKVEVLEETINKKERTIELMIQLTSSLGKMNFCAIAKNKKVLTVSDLTLAHYKGQEKKLPLILINSGKFAKNAEQKAQELGITLKSLEEKI